MHPAVIKVSPLEDYALAVVFDNGQEGVLDLKPHLAFGIFKQLRDPAEFKRVRISFDTIEWECGADLDPEFVHARCRISAANPI